MTWVTQVMKLPGDHLPWLHWSCLLNSNINHFVCPAPQILTISDRNQGGPVLKKHFVFCYVLFGSPVKGLIIVIRQKDKVQRMI